MKRGNKCVQYTIVPVYIITIRLIEKIRKKMELKFFKTSLLVKEFLNTCSIRSIVPKIMSSLKGLEVDCPPMHLSLFLIEVQLKQHLIAIIKVSHYDTQIVLKG